MKLVKSPAFAAVVAAAFLIGGLVLSNRRDDPAASSPGAEKKPADLPQISSNVGSQLTPGVPGALARAETKEAVREAGASKPPVFKILGKTTGQPLVPGAPVPPQGKLASRQAQGRVTRLERPSFAELSGLKPGDTLSIPLSDRESIPGAVQFVTSLADGVVSVIGTLVGRQGSFTFESEAGKARGRMMLPEEETAYRIEDDGADVVLWKEVPLGEVICLPPKAALMSAKLDEQAENPTAPGDASDAPPAASPPPSEPAPILNSRASATYQFYLNFNGETVSGTQWNSQYNGSNPIVAAAAGLTAAQIASVFDEVAEYYRPFDVNVTTELAKYNAAGAAQRMKCVVTPTNIAGGGDPSTLGIAYRNTFGITSVNSVCWAFTHDVYEATNQQGLLVPMLNGLDAVAVSIAHELGHTVGLYHDGLVPNAPSSGSYFAGHGQGSVNMAPSGYQASYNSRWGPVMGSPVKNLSITFNGSPALIRNRADVVQWSKGEYLNGNNKPATGGQDDVAIIAGQLGYIPDEDGNTPGTAAQLSVTGTTVNQSGVTSQQADVDYFRFGTTGGTTTINALAAQPCLDVSLQILDVNGSVVASDSPSPSVNASITTTLTAGVYYVKISGVGDGDAGTNGYSSYGSIGAYTLTGTGNFLASPPSVSTPTFSNLTGTSATLGGTVHSDNGAPITARGVVYSPTSANANPVIGASGVVTLTAGGTTGSFTLPSSALSPGTDYIFRVYATNSVGTSYTLAGTFTTLIGPPTVTTPSFANVTGSSAVLGGTLESDGGAPVAQRGVYIVEIDRYIFASNGGTGAFSVPVTGLQQGTTYSFMAFASNNQFVSTSTIGTFTTLTAPTLTYANAYFSGANFASVVAILGSDQGSPIIEKGIVYALAASNPNPVIGVGGVTKVISNSPGNDFYADMHSLLPGTTYAFRAYAINLGGTTYTTVATVTTRSESPYIYGVGDSQTASHADLSATVWGWGYDTTVGFSWGTTSSYGQTSPVTPSTLPGGVNGAYVTVTLTGLNQHTTYHYRFTATSSRGTTIEDRTFTTSNSVPVAIGQGGLNTPIDTPLQITLAATDGDPLIYAVATPPPFGAVVIAGNIATYTPTAGYNGADSFTFTASDSFGGTSPPATIGLSVGTSDTPPLLAVDSYSPYGQMLYGSFPFTGVGGTSPGSLPSGTLLQGRDGNYYGTTRNGGTADLGTVFKMSPAGVLTTMVAFTGTGGANPGSEPYGGIIQGRDGNFYGMTSQGGSQNLGTVFKLTPQGTLSTLLHFTGTTGGVPGSNPRGRLVQGADGHFYGMTSAGGAANSGTAFRMTVAGVHTLLVTFPAGFGGSSVPGPEGDLIQSSDGDFYGLTPYGGTDNGGTAFRMTPAGTLTTFANFGSGTGLRPQGTLVQDSAGTFYGVTWLGGENSAGAVFSISSAGVISRLFSFTGTGGAFPGAQPQHGLARGRDGNFYGVTTRGGGNDWGTIFKVTPGGQFTLLTEVRDASSALLEGSDGSFYGTTWAEGAYGFGRVYRCGLPSVVMTTAEGATATRTGTFSDAEGNATVTLTASTGTITKNNAAGTWEWSAIGPDGPASSTVTITATDSSTNIASAVMTFNVTNAAPVSSVSGPATGRTGVPVSFSFTATDPSPADQAAGFAWNLGYGDGSNPSLPGGTASPQILTHTFANPGNYQITANAVDKNGGWGSYASHWINVQSNQAPVVRVDGAGTAYSFNNAASLITGRNRHTASVLHNGKVLVVGGFDSSGALVTAELYDPATNTWSAAGSLTTARYSHTASVLSNGKILVAGGYGSSGYPTSSAELYDPATNSWTTAGTPAYSRAAHQASVLNNGNVLVTGGWGPDYLKATEIYNPATNSWSAAAPITTGRYHHTASVLTNGKVLVTGGINQAAPLSSSELYDPATNSWTASGSLATPRGHHAASVLPNGRVLVTGGGNAGTSVELYNPLTNSWSPAGSLTSERALHTANVLSSGKVLVTGGNANGYLTSTELYDPATNSWTALGGLATARSQHAASELSNGTVLVTGGNNDNGLLNSSELIAPPPPVTVAAAEGTPAMQTGTFSDADGNSSVTLTASSGTISQNNGLGTWIWSATDTDGPSNSTVTITARDDANEAASALITFMVTNGAPIVSIAAPLTTNMGVPVNYTFAAFDVSQQDQMAGFAWSINFGDGTGDQSLPPGSASPSMLTHTFASAGEFTVTAAATDKDGGVSAQAIHRISIVGLPEVGAPTATDVTASTVTLGGQVTGDGGGAITERGVVYAKTNENTDPLLAGTNVRKVPVGGTTGVFTTSVTGLTPNTSYSFKAFATNNVGTSYTNVATFTTQDERSFTFNAASDVGVTVSSYDVTGASANLTLGFAPAAGTNLTLVRNTGPAFITGEFSNLPNGSTVSLNYSGTAYPFVVWYYGGTSGRDLMLLWPYTGLAAWGQGGSGQLGEGTNTQSNAPVAVNRGGVLAGKTIVQVARGQSFTLALTSEGKVYAWGLNSVGQLGDGTTTSRNLPVAVTTATGALAGKFVVGIAAGGTHSLAVCSDGTVAAWGNNFSGQLGVNDSIPDASVPMAVNTASGTSALFGKSVTAVAGGAVHSYALCSDGTVAAWGINTASHLGDGTTTLRIAPVAVSTDTALAGKIVTAIAAGNAGGLALCSDGTLAAWGGNAGQVGDNTTITRSRPVAVNTASGISALHGKTVTAIAMGQIHSLAVCSDGTLAAWGSNADGRLGIGAEPAAVPNVLVPTAVNGGALSGKIVKAIAPGSTHTVALCSDGTLAAWGSGTSGQLGDSLVASSNAPTLVSAAPGASVLAGRNISGLSVSDQAGFAMVIYGTAEPVAPVVTASVPANVTEGGATLGGTVASDSDATITERGVVFSRTSENVDPLIGGTDVTQVAANGTTGSFTVNVSSLSPGTNYSFKAYATNTVGTSYSDEAVFQTAFDNNADLASLVLTGATLSPVFVSSTLNYSVTVPYATSSLGFTTTKASSHATLSAPGSPTNLAVGVTNLSFVVTAQDGVTTKTYTVLVTRETEALSNWNATFFGGSTTNTAPAEDFDGDGVPNVLEFAFGMDPASSSTGELAFNGDFSGGGTVVPTGGPVVGTQNVGQTQVHWAVFVRRKDYVSSHLSYVPRFSDDLLFWQDNTDAPTVLADDGVNQLVGVPYPTMLSNGQAPKFFTISVSILP